MKVLFISNPNSTHTQRWVHALSERGISVYLYSFRKAEDPLFYKILKNVELSSFKEDNYTKRSTITRLFVYYIPLIISIRKIYKTVKPDIVNAHYISNNGLFTALACIKPFVLTVWGSDIFHYPKQGLLRKWLTKFVLKRANTIVSSSNVMACEISKYTKSKNIEVIPFGVDCLNFKPNDNPKSDDGIVIGTVKSLKKIYRIDMLIEAFSKIEKKFNAQLMIVGGGEEEKKLKKLARKLEVHSKVHFMGTIKNYDLPRIYNVMDIFVSLSKFESFGVSTVEAMACELPVISSDAPGFKEVMINRETGIMITNPNADIVAKTIEEMIVDHNMRKEMGKKGRKRVLELYDWENNVTNMINVLKKVSI